MKFRELCEYFERVEATSKRLEKTTILAELLKKTEGEEAAVIINLSLGQLEAPYKRIQFNLAEKMLIRAIAMWAAKSVDEVGEVFKRIGDIGEVVRVVARNADQTKSAGELNVTQVYAELVHIARESGSGSQDRKIVELVKLLKMVSQVEAKYIVRMVNESLRLGFSESTILDVLSYYVTGDKTYSEQLEQVYQMRPDVARLAQQIVNEGIEKTLQMASVELGVPVVPALAQRLSSVEEMIEKMRRVYVEPKLDGTRVQIHYSASPRFGTSDNRQTDGSVSQQTMFEEEKQTIWVKTYTRNLDENTAQFPELLQIGHEIAAESVILDAEAVGYDPVSKELLPFQMTITRKRKHDVGEVVKRVPLLFFVFDIMYLDGESLLAKPLRERRAILERVLKPKRVLALNPQIETEDAVVVREYHAEQLEKGLEGVLIKRVEGEYTPGRAGFNWVKLKEVESAEGKLADTIDCTVLGYYRGKGKRSSFGLGAFLVGIRGDEEQILTIAKIGTGLSDEQFRELYARLKLLEIPNPTLENLDKQQKLRTNWAEYVVQDNLVPDVWVEPGVVVEVAADEITISPSHTAGLALRFPRLVKFRDDKGIGEITTLEEIKGMMINKGSEKNIRKQDE